MFYTDPFRNKHSTEKRIGCSVVKEGVVTTIIKNIWLHYACGWDATHKFTHIEAHKAYPIEPAITVLFICIGDKCRMKER